MSVKQKSPRKLRDPTFADAKAFGLVNRHIERECKGKSPPAGGLLRRSAEDRGLQRAQSRREVPLEERQKPALVSTGCVEDEVVEPGVHVFRDFPRDLVGV